MSDAWDIDACRRVAEVIGSMGYDVSLKRLDAFTGKEGVIVRELPVVTVHEELDGSHVDDMPVYVVVRRRSEQEARSVCRAIEFALDGAQLASGNGSYRWISTQIYTHTQQLPLDEGSFYAYDLRIKVQMEVERN